MVRANILVKLLSWPQNYWTSCKHVQPFMLCIGRCCESRRQASPVLYSASVSSTMSFGPHSLMLFYNDLSWQNGLKRGFNVPMYIHVRSALEFNMYIANLLYLLVLFIWQIHSTKTNNSNCYSQNNLYWSLDFALSEFCSKMKRCFWYIFFFGGGRGYGQIFDLFKSNNYDNNISLT